MFSILDILKKSKQEKKRLESEKDNSLNPGQADMEGAALSDRSAETASLFTGKTSINLSSVLTKESIAENIRLLGQIYAQAYDQAKQIYSNDLKFQPGVKKDIDSLVARMSELVEVGAKESLRLCLAEYPNNEEFLYYHVVNVCFMSLEIGLALGYDHTRLLELGTAAFLHDIGLAQCKDIISRADKFNPEEYNRIKQHPKIGEDILKRAEPALTPGIIAGVSQEHERMDGTGYPDGLESTEISEYPQIIAVMDVYEALTHRRPYRNKNTPAHAINVILNNKKAFSARIIKALIESFGIFPVGFLVRLNTKETAQVYKNNPTSPLRPQISVMFDQEGKELKDIKSVDLLTTPLLYIEECLEYFKRPNGE
ncbi:MAG: HD domain-containing phosphohydrolase [Candidatus Omnitrophota bacterium]|jgi:HD-GYP domain-containing protein (c-di-GMP phosphodiesterase class II)